MKLVYVGDVADFHFRDKLIQIQSFGNIESIKVFSGFSVEHLDPLFQTDVNKVSRFSISLTSAFFSRQLVRNFTKGCLYIFNFFWILFFSIRHRDHIFHSFTMYYIFLISLVRQGFIATPQGSEILVRFATSKIYRSLCLFALRRAKYVIVDSAAMHSVLAPYGISAYIHKNGFDTQSAISQATQFNGFKSTILSVRNLRPLYRILDLVRTRNDSESKLSIKFVYPSYDTDYFNEIKKLTLKADVFLGKLSKQDLYSEMSSALLVVSIPSSDSSPRSVYESILCGSIVAVTEQDYLNELPDELKSRIIIVDLSNPFWLSEAITKARILNEQKYYISDTTLDILDEKRLIQKLVDKFYGGL